MQFYLKLVYVFPQKLRVIPFEVKIGNRKPDKILYNTLPPIFDYLSLLCAIIVDCLILYWYFEAFFGQVTKVEFSVAICLNSIFIGLNTGQWVHISKFHRMGGLNLANFMLELDFRSGQIPSLSNELICITIVGGAVGCPLMPYPLLLFMAWYLPGILRLPLNGADLIAASVFGDSWMASFISRQFIIIVIAVALIDSIMRKAILLQWLFSFLCSMNQKLQVMLTTFKNGTAGVGWTQWNTQNSSDESNFLQIEFLYSAFHDIFGKEFATDCVAFLISVVYTVFLIVSPAVLPIVISLVLGIAGSLIFIVIFILFDQATKSHIRIQDLILGNRKKFRSNTSAPDYKFWKSMKPPRSTILNLCSFETREFLLVIWANVVMQGVINLLLAF